MSGSGSCGPGSRQFLDRLTRAGTGAGLVAAVIYLVWSVFPLPDVFDVLFHVAFGPLVVAGFLGIGAALWRGGPSVPTAFGTVYGALSGAFFASMTIVQMSNLDYHRRFIREAADPATEQAFRQIFRGVFTVQLGLDLVWDVFVTSGAILLAAAMIGRSRAATAFGVAGIGVAGLTLVLNLWTLPVPPAEAGLFDAGPYTGGWFLLVSVWVLFFGGLEGRVGAAPEA